MVSVNNDKDIMRHNLMRWRIPAIMSNKEQILQIIGQAVLMALRSLSSQAKPRS